MAKIKGKFCPLTDELGEDDRFIIESTDLDKLLYILVMYTCNMTRHKAPKNPLFYKRRYGLRAKTGQIVASLGRLQVLYPNVSWGDKNLSLLNSATYKSQFQTESEVEREVDKESEAKPDFLNLIKEKDTEIRAYLDTFLIARGWQGVPRLTDKIFSDVTAQVKTRDPRYVMPYFKKSLVNYINHNAEWLSTEVKKERTGS